MCHRGDRGDKGDKGDMSNVYASGTPMNVTQQAISYIMSCCGSVGVFRGSTDVHRFLKQVASQMAASSPSAVFPGRYIEHVACAVDMVASNHFTSSPAAIASLYLATRFEFYFRILSGKLEDDGRWKSKQAQGAACAAISDPRLKKKQISSLALAYKIMKLDHSRQIVPHCAYLDNSLYPKPITVVGGKIVADIGDRIEFGRHAAAHGQWGDISAEALFYGLMTAVVFYNQA
jgi:hypothetical protein